MDETQNLSEIEGSTQPALGSGSSSDEAENLSDTKGSPCTPSEVEAIFFAALNEKTAAARADYLARACGDNVTLRLRVERLLLAHPEAVDFLAQPAVERRQVERLDSVEDNGGIPAVIGRYRVLGHLGEGGFGRVYLAHDDQLDRRVAIKVPNPMRIARPEDADAFLVEARILAKLDHPHIVPVHDMGRTEDGHCFVVSKLVEGNDLAARVARELPSFQNAAELVAIVAEALHYAHTRGLVHRDIKPANILIDASGKPSLADFGLALRDADFGKVGSIAGTPAYMSPEQARAEGHRVDGRSDIFSLGVVFYELLTGKRPFRGDSHLDVMEQITTTEPRPPRQINDTIPKELERICHKAMMKRASDRYTTAKDMAEDLRLFLQTESGTGSPVVPAVPVVAPGSTLEAAPLPPTSQQPDSDQRPIKIVPKGLRSFDQNDADFFLELLPGPRDRDGLPESIRFWKRKIEQTDLDMTFQVGLIYGPSGCGKSSMVKAGLLPRLGRHVYPVYVEATADETEARLLKGIRKACPELPRESGLVDSLAHVRMGGILPPQRKVLLVIDQFEQWLFANRALEHTELIAALRQCDGEHVQAIVMVRDDFWLAASRFMRDLEIRLLEGENSALVDLFDPRHGRRVLMAFGSAYGALPDRIGNLNGAQESFLEQSISGLAQDGKIIPVRLALFAEMMKGKPWTPATLREVGGAEGVGLTFLEETFSASTARPEHRFHQKAAQAVLKVLLPESFADIRGQMRSRRDLLDVSGYAHRPRDFDDLIRILDKELRLITPTDPEALETTPENTAAAKPPLPPCPSGSPNAERVPEGRVTGSDAHDSPLAPDHSPLTTHYSPYRYYQLTHDYLVHSLRDWLTRKQRETRRGRAALRLAERSSLWNLKPENRHLPSALEWANIRLLTRRKDWSESQRRMMRQAARVHGLRGLGLAILIALVSWGSLEGYGSLQAAHLIDSLRTANIRDVPARIEQLRTCRRWAGRPLAGLLASTENDRDQHLRASLARLALWPGDRGQAGYLYVRLLGCSPAELPVIWGILRQHDPAIEQRLWPLLDDAKADKEPRFRAACALANADSAQIKNRWDNVASLITDQFLTAAIKNPGDYATLIETLRPVRKALLFPLARVFRDAGRFESERSFATTILIDYASDDPRLLADLLMDAGPKAYASLFPVAQQQAAGVRPVLQAEIAKSLASVNEDGLEVAKDRLAQRQARAAIALVRLGDADLVWPSLRYSPDPRLRSYIVNWLNPLGADPKVVAAELGRLDSPATRHLSPATQNMDSILFHPETSVRRALILALGAYGADTFSAGDHQPLIPKLLDLYRNDPDTGIHGSAEWVLRQWKQGNTLEAADAELSRLKDPGERRWFVNSRRQTFVRIEGPVEFRMGSPEDEPDRSYNETPDRRVISHRFTIATKEVTVEQYQEFVKANPGVDHARNDQYSPDPKGPMNHVTWYRAAAYCNWLSAEEGLPKDQWCYLPNEQKKYDQGMKVPADFWQRTGYRLPSEAEWEYASRAGAMTSRHYGLSVDLLEQYARYQANSHNHAWPCGSLVPNDLGLFDTLGNVYEWCQERSTTYQPGRAAPPMSDIIDDAPRMVRGGAFPYPPAFFRSAFRAWFAPSYLSYEGGFRLARTYN